jgi:hypothetical protein
MQGDSGALREGLLGKYALALEALEALLVAWGKHTHAWHIAVVNDSVQFYPFRAAQ